MVPSLHVLVFIWKTFCDLYIYIALRTCAIAWIISIDKLPDLVKSALTAACNSGKVLSWKVQ